jgi:predicted dehydrogenase/threonine dehydrogenase-like Zn-dependent dehydrogenase
MLKLISKSDGLKLAEHSLPNLGVDDVLIRTIASCYSKGTESSTAKNHQKPFLKKVLDNRDKIADLFLKRDFSQLIKKFKSQKDSVINMGYSASGEVIAKGKNVKNVLVSDTVVVVGSSANHGQFSVVPQGLCVPINKNINPISASCAAVASIALNSVQIANPLLGSNILIIGCGLIGQFLIQFLSVSGAKVTCVDLDDWRFKQSRDHGASICLTSDEFDKSGIVNNFDSVFVATPTLDAKTWNSIGESAKFSAKVLMVGAADLNCPRDVFYKKHLSFHSPHSYGPGRGLYDFEVLRKDFPCLSNTWDVRSNINLFLDLLNSKKISTDFIHIYKVDGTSDDLLISAIDNPMAYSTILDWTTLKTNSNLCLDEEILNSNIENFTWENKKNISLIGYSDFSKEAHIPFITNNKKLNFKGVCNRTPIKLDAIKTISKSELADGETGTVVISSNHASHASSLLDMIDLGKFCIIDKPLCISSNELEQILGHEKITHAKFLCFMSRRYSKHIRIIKEYMSNNLGPYHADFLFQVPKKDPNSPIYNEGGRLIGEMCHHIDLAIFLLGEPCAITYADNEVNIDSQDRENSNVLLSFKDGSSAFIRYTSIGDSEGSKEKIKISFGNQTIKITDFKKTELITQSHKKVLLNEFDKGFNSMWKKILTIIENEDEVRIKKMSALDIMVTKILLREKI